MKMSHLVSLLKGELLSYIILGFITFVIYLMGALV